MHPAFGVPLAYTAGSFPSAYLAGRLLKGIDLRTVGSGNLGATNVYRTLGAPAALIVLLLDIAKGALAVRFLPAMVDGGTLDGDPRLWWALAYGVAAILGHAKPVFLLWKGGGKGVATAAGALAILAPVSVGLALLVCAAVVWYSGFMSAGSLAAAVIFPFFVWLDRGVSPVFWVGLGLGAFICWSHRTNYQRLRAGTEHRLFPKRHTGDGGS